MIVKFEVSLLENPEEISERTIYEQLYSYLEDFQVANENTGSEFYTKITPIYEEPTK